MKYKIIPSKRFEKDMKRCQKRGYDMQLILVMLNTGTHSDLFSKKYKK